MKNTNNVLYLYLLIINMCCIFVLYLCKCSTITNHDEHFTEESTKSIELNENIYTDTKHNLRDKLIFYDAKQH